jgi:hypothetical protein
MLGCISGHDFVCTCAEPMRLARLSGQQKPTKSPLQQTPLSRKVQPFRVVAVALQQHLDGMALVFAERDVDAFCHDRLVSSISVVALSGMITAAVLSRCNRVRFRVLGSLRRDRRRVVSSASSRLDRALRHQMHSILSRGICVNLAYVQNGRRTRAPPSERPLW